MFNMADKEAESVNSSGDSAHQEGSVIANNSQHEGSFSVNSAGDSLGDSDKKEKKPTGKLTRLPTITINDESFNESSINGDTDNSVLEQSDNPESDNMASAVSNSVPSVQPLETEKSMEFENTNVSATIENSRDGETMKTDQSSSDKTIPERKVTSDAETGEDKEDEPLDILGNGLLLKEIITPSEKDNSRPTYSQQVTLRTHGVLENGNVVDKNEAITFTLGDGDVIQAWDLCTSLMGLGEVCRLQTDAKYAYGSQGRSPDVPANAKIIYTLQLLKTEDPIDIDKLSVEERTSYGNKKRERGNDLFVRSDYTGAINSYSKALKILNGNKVSHSDEPRLLQELLDIRMKCYNNIAAAQLKVEAFDAAIKSCDEVIKVQPDNVKALFRKGKAHAAKGQTQLAITVLKKTLKLDPESKIVQQELFKQTKKLKQETETEKNMYRKMFGIASPPEPEKKKSSMWKSWGLLATGALAMILLSVGIAVYRKSPS